MIIISLQFLILAGLTCIVFFRKLLFSYSNAKGKNLATKEDIGDITEKIEDVKLEYAQQLEATRAELSSQLKNSGFRYEKEYEILSELSSLLVDVRDASLSLRPALDYRDPDKTQEEVKKERLTRFYNALRALYLEKEKKRPFYPESIYAAINHIERESRSESIEYQHRDPEDEVRYKDYWEKAQANQESITQAAEDAMTQIRNRVTNWDAIR